MGSDVHLLRAVLRGTGLMLEDFLHAITAVADVPISESMAKVEVLTLQRRHRRDLRLSGPRREPSGIVRPGDGSLGFLDA